MSLTYTLQIQNILNKKDGDFLTAGDVKNLAGCVKYLLENAGTTSLSTDIVDALNAATTPTAGTPFLTLSDISSDSIASLAASGASAANVILTRGSFALKSGSFVTPDTLNALEYTDEHGTKYNLSIWSA